jgi:two-component system, cell cycle response regulator
MEGHDAPNATILVADDDATVRLLIRRWLEKAEFNVLEAADGKQALSIAQEHAEDIHCIILDVMMPELDGFEVLSSLKEDLATENIPVLMLTARANLEEDLLRAATLGATEHLSKPFSGPVLIAKISRAARETMGQKALRARLEAAERESKVDALTQLHNRRYFDDRLRYFQQKAASESSPFSLLLLDVDHFKSINDRFGHPEGDRVLVHVAHCIRKCLRTEDLAFRYGGEEFAALLANCPREGLPHVVERVRARLAGSPLAISGESLTVKVSGGGVAVDAANGFRVEHIVDVADRLLYNAKAKGRNRIIILSGSGPLESPDETLTFSDYTA